LLKKRKIKYERETKNLLKAIKDQKRKKDCLDKIFKNRQLEDERKRRAKEVENQIIKLKSEAKKQVSKTRKSLKKTLEEIRRKAKRRNRLLDMQLQKLRGAMAQSLLSANKLGSSLTCKEKRGNKIKMQEYCNINFSNNFAKNVDCMNHEDFCYVCCENEFGNMYLKERDKCYDMCDLLAKQDLKNGEWMWVEDNKNK